MTDPPDIVVPVPSFLEARDPISRAGLVAQLEGDPRLAVVDDLEAADVAVALVDVVDEDATRSIAALRGDQTRPVVLIATTPDDLGVLHAVQAGACAILRRAEATAERVAAVLVAAAKGHGSVPPDLLGSLLAQVGSLQRTVLQPRGLLLNGFTEREIEVLRLVADGCDTGEIATRLAYSERTVKNVLHAVTARYELRNRSHAVAYALRAGVI
jgi:DNA-binding NarL/FixJ family response regulator